MEVDIEKLLQLKNTIILSFWIETIFTILSLITSLKFNVPYMGLIYVILLLSSYILYKNENKYAGIISMVAGILMVLSIFKVDIFSFILGCLLINASFKHNKGYTWNFSLSKIFDIFHK